jgi:hypothetical protein
MITALSIGNGGLGRFGNQMFTIASCIGIARKSGQPFAFPHWRNHDNAIFGDEVTDFEQVFANPLPHLPEGMIFDLYGYFWGYRDVVLPNGNWSIDAHMQSVKFFSHCIEEVRHFFTMKEEYPQNDYVAIHYRAGDYIGDERAYHPRCSKEYYENAMQLFRPEQQYAVFTDDISAWRELYPDLDSFEFCDDYVSDFKRMKSCKSFITANSSYSHMAALLGSHPDKKIIMPKHWFGSQAGGLNFDDLYPPNAIII